jgi:hypothetical protein
MLQAAWRNDWDTLIDAETCCASLIERLKAAGDASQLLDEEGRKRKHEIIRRVLADDAQIRDLTQPWLRQLSAHLGHTKNARVLEDAYRSLAPGHRQRAVPAPPPQRKLDPGDAPMINVQTLGTLLRTLQSGDASARALAPLQPLAPTQAIKPIAPENTHSQQTGARDAGRGPARLPASPGELLPGAPTAGRGATAAIVNLGSQPGTAAATALLAEPDANPASVVTLGTMPVDEAAPRVAGRAAAGTTAIALPANAALPQPAPGPGGAASLSLSSAAHLVDALARLPGGEPIRPAAPLAPPAAAPEVIARALQYSIAASGVFYESHLARWALQRHPEGALRQEPQAAWPSPAAPATPVAAQADVDAGAQAMPLPNAPSTPAPAAAAGAADAAPLLVRQQLEVLETGQILWRGDLWPGQPAAIEIGEDEANRESGQAPVWRTRLALTLPGLGAIEARLALAGQRIHLHLVAGDAQSESALREALPELAAALSARALDVAPVVVDHGRRR